MTAILARFARNGERIKIVPDLDPGYHYLITTPADLREPPTVQRFQRRYLDLHLDLYALAGYRRLALCPACQGSGMEWYTDRHDEADQDVCSACQGEGGR